MIRAFPQYHPPSPITNACPLKPMQLRVLNDHTPQTSHTSHIFGSFGVHSTPPGRSGCFTVLQPALKWPDSPWPPAYFSNRTIRGQWPSNRLRFGVAPKNLAGRNLSTGGSHVQKCQHVSKKAVRVFAVPGFSSVAPGKLAGNQKTPIQVSLQVWPTE